MPAAPEETRSVSTTELASFTRQLGAMLQAGVDVLRALRIASRHTANAHLIEVSEELGRVLEDGRELHVALSRHPDLFDPFYVQMARQGEEDGTLGQNLQSVADYLDHAALRAAPASAGPPASPAVAAQPMPAPDPSSRVAPTLLGALGAAVLGTGVLWSAAAAGLLPGEWLGPAAALWSGAVLVASAYLLQGSARKPFPPAAAAPEETAPPARPVPAVKSRERQVAEAEGVVRAALDEQQDEDEASALKWFQVDPNGAGGDGRLDR